MTAAVLTAIGCRASLSELSVAAYLSKGTKEERMSVSLVEKGTNSAEGGRVDKIITHDSQERYEPTFASLLH